MPLKKQVRRNTTKKRRKFSNQSRLMADARMLSKGINTLYQGKIETNPSERYGANESQVVLKRSLKSQLRCKISSAIETSKITKNPLKIISAFIREQNIGEYRNGPVAEEGYEKRDNGRIRITKKKGTYYKNRKKYRAALMHEFFHSTHIPPNDVGAHAFENYLENKLNKSKLKRTSQDIVNRAIALEILLKKLNEMKLGEYETKNKMSPAKVGEELGIIANDIELQTGKRGSGLFFLKEILIGKSATHTISRISKNEFDKEIRAWLKMNPRLARLL